ncbi:hypothetical protein NB717_003134 [Xanthomonas sacchari]|nr:hypothetical protein [Xanthomonas sacchari]
MHVGQVVVRDQCGHVQFHLGAARFLAGIQVRQLALADAAHRAFQQFGVQAEADLGHLPALVLAQQFAGAADLQIVGGQGEAGAQFVHRGDGVQPLLRIGSDAAPVRHQQIGVGAVMRTADAAAQLVQLRQAEAVGAVDDDGVGVGDVDARFDDRGRQQHVEALLLEIQHHLFQLALGHLPVGDADARLRHQLAQLALHAADALHVVVQEVQLAAARQFALEGFAQQRVVPLGDEGLHRQPVRRRRGDDRQVAQAGHGHVQGTRDRRGGQGQQVHVGAQRLQRFLLAHAEALLLVDDDHAQVLELHVRLQQAMGADDHIDAAGGDLLQLGLDLLAALEARQHFDLERVVGEAVAEVAVVLFGQQRGRHQHRHLLAGAGRSEGRAHRDLGLAEADVAADHAVHRLAAGQVAQGGVDRGQLVGGFLEREAGGERLVHRPVHLQRQPGAGLAARLDLQQLRGHVAHLLGGLAFGLGPLFAAQRMQRRGLGRGAGVAADQVQLRDRHVQPVALGVFDFQELAGHAAGIEHDQPAVAADAVVLMHDRRALGQLAQVADDRFRLAPHTAAAPRLAGTLGEQLALGQHRDPRLLQREAVVERRNRDSETCSRKPLSLRERGWGEGPTASGVRLRNRGTCRSTRLLRSRPRRRRTLIRRFAPPSPGGRRNKCREIRQHLRLQLRGRQHFQQRLAAARRIGRDQHPARVVIEEALQRRARRGVLGRYRQRRQRLVAKGLCLVDARVVGGPHVDARQPVEALAQRVRRLVQLLRRQQRALHVVAALLVAGLGLRPERIGRGTHARCDQRQHVLAQIIEQGGGGLACAAAAGVLEEQRQVVLDARRRQPGLQVLVQRAAPGVDVEAFAQRGQYPLHADVVHRHFAPGQHAHRLHMVQRALRFRVEGADRIDVLVQQFDPQRCVGAHRIHVEQAAAHGEVARVHHLRHVAVAGAFQSPLLRVQVQALAHAQVETAADDVAQRRHPLHQRLHRHHHDALGQRRQPVQRGQALADDVRVRTELVVGQGFPIRERHHRQARILPEQAMQVGFELMRALVVACDHQQRPAVRGRGAGDVPGQSGGGRGGAPVRAELAGLGQRRNGEGKGRHGPTSLARSGPGARGRGHVRAGAEAAC